jgi:hypothetical protein
MGSLRRKRSGAPKGTDIGEFVGAIDYPECGAGSRRRTSRPGRAWPAAMSRSLPRNDATELRSSPRLFDSRDNSLVDVAVGLRVLTLGRPCDETFDSTRRSRISETWLPHTASHTSSPDAGRSDECPTSEGRKIWLHEKFSGRAQGFRSLGSGACSGPPQGPDCVSPWRSTAGHKRARWGELPPRTSVVISALVVKRVPL